MRHQNSVVTGRSWLSIMEFYRGLVEDHGWNVAPMLEFVEQVAASRYASGLYPITSVAKLIVAQTPQFEMKREVLEVEVIQASQRFHFEFWEESRSQTPWSGECGPGEAFALLERLLSAKRWFLAAAPSTEAEPSAADASGGGTG